MKPSKNRIYCPECGRAKMLFDSEEKAERFIKFNKGEMSGRHPVRAYYCVACGGWHTTSQSEHQPGLMDSDLIIKAYRQDKETKLESQIARLERYPRLSSILEFLQKVTSVKRPVELTHEQLMRVKCSYLSADRYHNDQKCRNRICEMFDRLGIEM